MADALPPRDADGDVVTFPAGKAPKITNGGFTTAQVLLQIPPADSRY